MDQQIRVLRELLIRVDHPTQMTPGDVAYFFGIFRELFKLLFDVIRNDPALAPNRLSAEEILKVEQIFAELSDNFFPMAHTNKRIEHLQIVERDSIVRVLDFLTAFAKLNHVSSNVYDLSGRVRDDLLRY